MRKFVHHAVRQYRLYSSYVSTLNPDCLPPPTYNALRSRFLETANYTILCCAYPGLYVSSPSPPIQLFRLQFVRNTRFTKPRTTPRRSLITQVPAALCIRHNGSRRYDVRPNATHPWFPQSRLPYHHPHAILRRVTHRHSSPSASQGSGF